VKSFDDIESSNSVIDYFNFQSTEQGYDFMVRNVILTPITQSEDTIDGKIGEFVDSPFAGPIITSDMILDLIYKYKP
jgi:hypothetical protein